MPFRSAVLSLAVLLAALPVEFVQAQTGKASAKTAAAAALPILPDRPGRWREALFEDEPRKYRCMREPTSSPLCVLANRMACETYRAEDDDGHMQFCWNAYVRTLPVLWLVAGRRVLDMQYRIEKVRRIGTKDIEAAERAEDPRRPTAETEPRPDDLVVTVLRVQCQKTPCPSADNFDFGRARFSNQLSETCAEYALRNEGTQWHLVWWPWEIPWDAKPGRRTDRCG
jgi:hypothetical protein